MDVKLSIKYEDIEIPMDFSEEEPFEKIFEEFVIKLNPDSKLYEYVFSFEKNHIDPKTSFSQNSELFGDKKEITIIAVKKLKVIKCPKCNYNDCIVNLKDYQVSYYGCEHRHSYCEMYDDYFKDQTMNNSKIKCCEQGCKKNQSNDPLDFYLCLTCTNMMNNNKSYCKEHILKHNKNHIAKKFDDKNYFCLKHFHRVIGFCFKCKIDLCKECKKQHSGEGHVIKNYEAMIPSEKEMADLEENLELINKMIADLKYIADNIIYMVNGSINIFKGYYNIGKDIIEKYKTFNKDFKNYEILKTLRNLKFSNYDIIKDLNSLIEMKEPVKQADKLIDIYMKRKNRYYGDINTNELKEEKDDDWVKEIEINEKRPISHKPNSKAKPIKKVNPY